MTLRRERRSRWTLEPLAAELDVRAADRIVDEPGGTAAPSCRALPLQWPGSQWPEPLICSVTNTAKRQPMHLVTSVAELALESKSLEDFHDRFLSVTGSHLGGAAGGVLVVGRDGHGDVANSLGNAGAYGAMAFTTGREFSAREMQACLGSASFLSSRDVFPLSRQEELTVFRDYLGPLHANNFVFRMWCTPRRLHFVAFVQQGHSERSNRRMIPRLNSIFPVMALTERLFSRTSAPATDPNRELTREYNLTTAEHETLKLVLRGLTNPEIAVVLGLSVNTVRNRVSECYRKLNVSRRAEAAFVLDSVDADTTPPERSAWDEYRSVVARARSRLQRGYPALHTPRALDANPIVNGTREYCDTACGSSERKLASDR
jgi:DNA-binding CsgD family transcriptional regulator